MSEQRDVGDAARSARVHEGLRPSGARARRERLSEVAPASIVTVARVSGVRAQQWLLLAGLLEGDELRVVSGGSMGDRVVEVDGRRVFLPARVAFDTLVCRRAAAED